MMRRLAFLLSLIVISSCQKKGKSEIVIVAIGDHEGRAEIAQCIKTLDSLEAKVIGVDLLFYDTAEFETDSLLLTSLKRCSSRLVMASMINYSNYIGASIKYPPIRNSFIFDSMPDISKGYCNAILGSDEFRSVTSFSLYEDVNGSKMRSFATEVAWKFDSLKTEDFLAENSRIVDLRYNETDVMGVFDILDLLTKRIDKSDIEGRIVLVGYLGLKESLIQVKALRGNNKIEMTLNDTDKHSMEISQILGFN